VAEKYRKELEAHTLLCGLYVDEWYLASQRKLVSTPKNQRRNKM
jgi:hypothetical protein